MPIFQWLKKLVPQQQKLENRNSSTESTLQQNGETNGHSSCTSKKEMDETDDQNKEQPSESAVELTEKLSTLQIDKANTAKSTEELDKSDYYSTEELDGSISVDLVNGVQDDSNQTETTDGIEATESKDIEANSDDSDDDSFYSNLFTNKKPQVTYESAPVDAFPCNNDSDSEDGVSNTAKTVKFFINKSKSITVAEHNNVEYPIGFLDLTAEQHDLLKIIVETAVELCFEPNSIFVQNNKLFIKRIKEQETSPKSKQPNSLWFKILNLIRIEFSTFEPFLAKYDNEIYFVGQQLVEEYKGLLRRAKMDAGIAIRLRKDRIYVDSTTQTLDVVKTISFGKQDSVVVISGSAETVSNGRDPNESIRRYVIGNCSDRFQILEIESKLLHSSIDDDCAEIYAEIDFPFASTEKKIQKNQEKEAKKIAEKKSQSTKEKKVETIATASVSDRSSPQIIRGTKTQKFTDEDEKRSQQICEYNYLENLPLEMMSLKTYAVPMQIKQIVDQILSPEELAKTEYMAMKKKKSMRNNESDYISGYKMMIHFEEEEQSRYLETFNQSDIQITYHMERQFWFPITPALSELSNAIEENLIDRFVLRPKYSAIKIKGDILGQVLRVRDRKIYIEILKESINKIQKLGYNKGTYYDISFKLNRVPFQLQHAALEFIENQELFTRLINNSYYQCNTSTPIPKAKGAKKSNRPHLMYEDTLLSQLNTEQQKAVQNIVRYHDKMPYVLFGPPGTGKTRTLVGAIEQIVRTTNEKILVCANSNAACDEIAERLVGILKEGEMYRFYAKSYKNEKINYRVRQFSNFGPHGITYPALEFLYKFRVLVCTLCSSGCLSRARIDKDIWKPNHFDYVFLDEAASAHETMAMIPIAGVCTSLKQIHAKIVVAGDPKQLDAVVKSNKAKSLGYSISWLEHLCSTNLYARCTETGQFNETYITQLVKNYRSHPHILRVSNELYYNNKLQPCAAQDNMNWYINSKFLPSKHFPMKFISVQGNCQKSVENSWYNSDEIDEVIKVIKQLLPPQSKKLGLKQITQEDIGVVTPYRKQRVMLSQKLRRINFSEIMVGTAEIFQGKEKPVMIISTVRSDRQLGFVGEPRRLNVVITRAKSLVCIIGDPHTLQLSKDWRHLIKYCLDNDSFIQSKNIFAIK